MLLNLSNHPASGWDAAQLNAARDFGGVKDLPFPAVPPEASEGEIAELADAYCARVLATPGVSAVHLMGEMTFCFALAARLKAAGVKCVASTTRRDVVETNGAKTSRFSFVRFREY